MNWRFGCGPEVMMQYLCLVYHEAAKLESMPQHEVDAVMCEVRAYSAELQQSGRCAFAVSLHPGQAVATVRLRNGTLLVSNGPGVTTNEQLGGLYLIDATDLNDAIRVSARLAPARLGCVEVRPVDEIASARV